MHEIYEAWCLQLNEANEQNSQKTCSRQFQQTVNKIKNKVLMLEGRRRNIQCETIKNEVSYDGVIKIRKKV